MPPLHASVDGIALECLTAARAQRYSRNLQKLYVVVLPASNNRDELLLALQEQQLLLSKNLMDKRMVPGTYNSSVLLCPAAELLVKTTCCLADMPACARGNALPKGHPTCLQQNKAPASHQADMEGPANHFMDATTIQEQAACCQGGLLCLPSLIVQQAALLPLKHGTKSMTGFPRLACSKTTENCLISQAGPCSTVAPPMTCIAKKAAAGHLDGKAQLRKGRCLHMTAAGKYTQATADHLYKG